MNQEPTEKELTKFCVERIKKSCEEKEIAKEVKWLEINEFEKELGIDLVTLFKAFNGLFYKKDNEIKFSCHIAVIDYGIYILEESMTIGEGIKLYFDDYGKTWALTKEVLS